MGCLPVLMPVLVLARMDSNSNLMSALVRFHLLGQYDLDVRWHPLQCNEQHHRCRLEWTALVVASSHSAHSPPVAAKISVKPCQVIAEYLQLQVRYLQVAGRNTARGAPQD
jgi:hypothetical protein